MADYDAPWYHGSPHELTTLRAGSWITQFREIAKAFSHKPSIISMSDDGQAVKHDGRRPGFLYTVAEPIGPGDVSPLPDTASTHWQTERDLRVTLVEKLPISDPPLITQEEIEELQKAHPQVGKDAGFFSTAGSGDEGDDRGR